MIICFGYSDIAEKEIKKRGDIALVCDNNPNLKGKQLLNVKVAHYDDLSWEKVVLVIISATSVSEIRDQLKLNKNFSGEILVAKGLENHDKISSLIDRDFSLFISSGLPSFQNSGGGIYSIRSKGAEVSVVKLHNGNTHGMVKIGENICFSDARLGLVLMSTDGEVKQMIRVPGASRLHGIDIWNDKFVVVDSGRDLVLIIDEDEQVLSELTVSNKYSVSGVPQHHVNDIVVRGDFAYVSMFSASGNWRRGIYDGAIFEINLKTGSKEQVRGDLKMPHSVKFIDDDLFVLNSFEGEILGYDGELIGVVNGFARGLDYCENLLLIGESRNRNFNKLKRSGRIFSVDSKLTIIDRDDKIAKSLILPNNISEIHSIILN